MKIEIDVEYLDQILRITDCAIYDIKNRELYRSKKKMKSVRRKVLNLIGSFTEGEILAKQFGLGD